MAHELVFKTVIQNKARTDHALMMYRLHEGREAALTPWHQYGKGSTTLCVDEIHDYLMTSAEVTLNDKYFINSKGEYKKLRDEYTVAWEADLNGDGAPDDIVLGSVGSYTNILSNKKFFESFRVWEEKGFAIETCGYLRGGSRMWCQVSLNINEKDFEVRKGDVVKPYFFMGHAHDGSLSITGGLQEVRIVCDNTMKLALGESDLTKFKHTGDVLMKANKIHSIAEELINASKKNIEQYRMLDSKQIKSDKEVLRFVNLIQGKKIDDMKGGRVHDAVAKRFEKGIGQPTCGEKTYWTLLNSFTEMVSYDLGNEKEGEKAYDRIARRLETTWFGTGAKSLDVAFDAAVNLYKAAA